MRIKVLILIFFLLNSCHAWAWNDYGHIAIAEVAYRNLNTTTKNNVDNLTNIIFRDALPPIVAKELKDHTAKLYVSDFAKLAIVLDIIRTDTVSLSEFFHTLNSIIPEELTSKRESNLGSMHYSNDYYLHAESHCQYKKPDDAHAQWIIEQIQNIAPNAENKYLASALLTISMHVIADIHQPLHNISRAEKDCQDDMGGNYACLSDERTSDNSCVDSLHKAWDRGLGVFDLSGDFQDVLKKLSNRYSQLKSKSERKYLANNVVGEWILESRQYAVQIYDGFSPNQKLTAEYTQKGQNIALNRAATASHRLKHFLERYFNTKTMNDIIQNNTNKGRAGQLIFGQ